MNQIPTDPFASAALENAMMYVPEISAAAQCSGQQVHDNQEQSQGTQEVNNGQQLQQAVQDGEREMFEDIVANTNPYLAALPDANLYITHNVNYFDSKRNLLRASNSLHDFYAFEKNFASEGASQADHIDLNDYEMDMDNHSDYSYSQADEEMLQLFDPEHNQWPAQSQPALGALRHGIPKLNCTFRQFNDHALDQDEADKISQPENQSVRNIQLHSLVNPANRSECCCAEDDFKDIGLDSTMSISINDQGGAHALKRPKRRQVSERESNALNSHRCYDASPFEDLHGKKRRDPMALGRQYVSRNALSQMNYKDLEDEQDQYLQCGLEADEDDFEKMLMLPEDEDSQHQEEFLRLSRHKSAFEKGRFAGSSYLCKSNEKTDLRKKKAPAVNFREDLNIEANHMTLMTPQQDSKQLLSQDDEFIIPISQTNFDGASLEQDKIESNINR